MNRHERKLAALKRNLGRNSREEVLLRALTTANQVMSKVVAAGHEEAQASLSALGNAVRHFGAASQMRPPNATDQKEALTSREAVVAEEMFRQVFPILVQQTPISEIRKAATETVAALRAGLDALRANASGADCECLEGKTRFGLPDDRFAPTDSAGLCQRCGRTRRDLQSGHPSSPEKRS